MPPDPLVPPVLFLHHQSLPSNPSRELLNSNSQMFALHFHKREGKHLESLPTNVPSERELFAKIDINSYHQFSFLYFFESIQYLNFRFGIQTKVQLLTMIIDQKYILTFFKSLTKMINKLQKSYFNVIF